jgi:hypothetical protein
VHTLRIPLAPSWKESGESAIPIGQGLFDCADFGCI